LATTKTAPKRPGRLRGFILLALAAIILFIAGIVGYVALRVLPNVPALDAVTDYRPKIPLRVYTADNVLIGEFGEEHRDFVPIKKIPDLMKKSLLAIEDARFYEHGAIDFQRGIGAVVSNLRHGFGAGGGSTITMQVARNFFLSREKHIGRKVNEIALAYKIEAALSKDEILELYMNQIYLGQRAYGFASAARAYFNKNLDQLSVAEMAMLAGLPQNPSRHNPVANPKRARERQHAVLGRMRALDYISEAQYQAALEEPLRVNTRGQEFDTHAEYVAELARQAAYAQFKEEAYTRGIKVTTTILKAEQEAAYASVRRNVIAYDQRHGWRGPEGRIELPADPEEREDAISDALGKRPSSDGLIPAVVLAVTPKTVRIETENGDTVDLSGAAVKFAQAGLSPNAKDALRLSPGAIVRVSKQGKGWAITQVPQVAAAFVAIDADSGAYHALVGGFDYNFQKFNHVTQAWRQPGSGMKPFVYSAALEKGYSPGTRILDAPLDLPGEDAGKTWSPQNDDFKWDGPITMREALVKSKNVPSVRLLRSVSVPFAHEFLGKFGFDLARQPKNFTLALGTGAVTPLQMAGAYAVFANGGYQVQPYLIAKIEDADGKVIQQAAPPGAHTEEQRVLDARNAYVTDSMLRDVTRYGTGAAATKALNRSDIAGKTGTTSDTVDGWFSGYGGNVVAVAWMGYDDPRSLGGREFGATLALPIWIDYMKVALAKRPQAERAEPEGLVRQNEDWVYAEYADTPVLGGIDLDQQQAADPDAPPADPNAPPTQQAPQPQQTQLQNSLF